MPKFYVASSLKNKEAVQDLIKQCTQNNWECSYDWTQYIMSDISDFYERYTALNSELLAIEECDVLIALPPLGRGSHIELGYAMVYCTPIVVLGQRDTSCLAYDRFEFLEDVSTLLTWLATWSAKKNK